MTWECARCLLKFPNRALLKAHLRDEHKKEY